MIQVEMSASVRATTGKGPNRQLRAGGLTPAVLYVADAESLTLQLDSKTLMAQLLEIHRRNAVVTLKIDNGTEKQVVIKEIQTEPVNDTLVHVDFMEIDIKKTRRFDVPLVFQGVAKGVDLGGILKVNAKSIVLEGKPLDIPDECVVDISDMDIGDVLNFGVCEIPKTVTMVSGADATCVEVIKQD